MLLHDWAMLRENGEVGLRPSHPHQLSGLRRSPTEQAAPSPKASAPAQRPASMDYEDRSQVLTPTRQSRNGPSPVPASVSEDIGLRCVLPVRAVSLHRLQGSSTRMLAWSWRVLEKARNLFLVVGSGSGMV